MRADPIYGEWMAEDRLLPHDSCETAPPGPTNRASGAHLPDRHLCPSQRRLVTHASYALFAGPWPDAGHERS
jgi:hypothetical protein